MATPEPLNKFIQEALRQGISRARIEAVLREAGWKPAQIKRALSAYADMDFPVPVPQPRAPSPPRDAFLYLLLFTTLYLSAYHLGSLLYAWLERLLPDTDTTGSFMGNDIRSSIAVLSVSLPIYGYVFARLASAIKRTPERRESTVRKWLTYFTLFITVSIIMGDFISMIYLLIGDEITLRYLLKFLVVGMINLLIFWYYLRDMREQET